MGVCIPVFTKELFPCGTVLWLKENRFAARPDQVLDLLEKWLPISIKGQRVAECALLLVIRCIQSEIFVGKGIIGLRISSSITFVKWIVYSIGSCLVVVITNYISIYFVLLIEYQLLCRYFDPFIRISSHKKRHLQSKLPDFLLSLRTTVHRNVEWAKQEDSDFRNQLH